MRITEEVGWRSVRYNRRRLSYLMIIGTLATPAGFVMVDQAVRPAFMFPAFMILCAIPWTLALAGFFFVVQETYFRYEVHAFALKGIDPWGSNAIRRWREEGHSPWSSDKETSYPEPGFVRLEYSIAYASIYQVRIDGSRERLWMRPWWADPADWEAFVAHLGRVDALEGDSR